MTPPGDYLGQLAARTLSQVPAIRPRLALPYETAPATPAVPGAELGLERIEERRAPISSAPVRPVRSDLPSATPLATREVEGQLARPGGETVERRVQPSLDAVRRGAVTQEEDPFRKSKVEADEPVRPASLPADRISTSLLLPVPPVAPPRVATAVVPLPPVLPAASANSRDDAAVFPPKPPGRAPELPPAQAPAATSSPRLPRSPKVVAIPAVRPAPAPQPARPLVPSARLERPAPAASLPPVVHVTIGRIEVRASSAPAPAPAPVASTAPRMTLDAYLNRAAARRT